MHVICDSEVVDFNSFLQQPVFVEEMLDSGKEVRELLSREQQDVLSTVCAMFFRVICSQICQEF